METFTRKIVDMMKTEGLFEWQGGPIIMSQVTFISCPFISFWLMSQRKTNSEDEK
jgi:hypothetical protein